MKKSLLTSCIFATLVMVNVSPVLATNAGNSAYSPGPNGGCRYGNQWIEFTINSAGNILRRSVGWDGRHEDWRPIATHAIAKGYVACASNGSRIWVACRGSDDRLYAAYSDDGGHTLLKADGAQGWNRGPLIYGSPGMMYSEGGHCIYAKTSPTGAIKGWWMSYHTNLNGPFDFPFANAEDVSSAPVALSSRGVGYVMYRGFGNIRYWSKQEGSGPWGLRGNLTDIPKSIAQPTDSIDWPVTQYWGTVVNGLPDPRGQTPQEATYFNNYHKPLLTALKPTNSKFVLSYDPHYVQGWRFFGVKKYQIVEAYNKGCRHFVFRTAETRILISDLENFFYVNQFIDSGQTLLQLINEMGTWNPRPHIIIEMGNEPDKTSVTAESYRSRILDGIQWIRGRSDLNGKFAIIASLTSVPNPNNATETYNVRQYNKLLLSGDMSRLGGVTNQYIWHAANGLAVHVYGFTDLAREDGNKPRSMMEDTLSLTPEWVPLYVTECGINSRDHCCPR